MSALDRLTKRKEELDKRWESLRERIGGLQSERERETRFEERHRLDGLIATAETDRTKVEEELEGVEKEIDALRLEAEATERERKQAYDEAIEAWERIQSLAPERPAAAKQIERLRRLKGELSRRNDLTSRLSGRFVEIKDIFAEVNKRLRESVSGSDCQVLIEQLLESKITPDEFKVQFQALFSQNAEPLAGKLDYPALSRSLRQGDVAFFLGARVPGLLDATLPGDAAVAAELANHVGLQPGERTVPEVAEYYLMTQYGGARELVRKQRQLLPKPQKVNPLYKLLAGIEHPLIIISAAQDSLLESAFLAASKRHVVVRSVVYPVGELRSGQLLIRYSDRDQPEEPKTEAELSRLAPFESGYTVIFKIRGELPSKGDPEPADLSSLVLAERSLIAFAGRMEKIIPDYLRVRLATRGLWFLGFEPRHWEDRLVAGAVLAGRTNAPEPARVVSGRTDTFETAYWANCNVRMYTMELRDFVEQLSGRRAAQIEELAQEEGS